MATQIGTVKQVTGNVVAIGTNGVARILNAGDPVFLGEVVKTISGSSKAILSMDNGTKITMLGNDVLTLDDSVTRIKSFGNEAVADTSSLQEAIMQSNDISQLADTAAGGGISTGGMLSAGTLNETVFAEGGHESRVDEVGISAIFDKASANIFDPKSIATAQSDTNLADDTSLGVVVYSATPFDTSARADGIIDEVLVRGHSEPNADVVIRDKNGRIIGTGRTDENGNFEIVTKAVDPGEEIQVEVTDEKGNKGKSIYMVDEPEFTDEIPPEVTIDSVTPVDTDTKADGEADVTIVKGHSDEPFAPVIVTDGDGNKIGEGTTDKDGNFEIKADPVKSGTNVTVTVTDKAGNEGKDDKNAGDTEITGTLPEPNHAPVVEISDPVQPTEGKANTTDTIAKVTTSDEDGDEVTVTVGPSNIYNYDPSTGNITLTDEGVELVNKGKDLPDITATGNDGKGEANSEVTVTKVVPETDTLPKVDIDTVVSID
nr:retention module-containing protein [Campylobacter sp.]